MMETAAPGLHDAILLCAGIATVYMVVAVLQLVQLRQSRTSLPAREPSLALPLHSEGHDGDFAGQLKQRSMESDLKRLGREVDRLHEELRATRDEIRQLRSARTVPPPQAATTAAPLYNDAIGFAQRGIDATGIATRCGISRGEAELIAALARDPKNGDMVRNEPSYQANPNREHHHDRYRAAA